MNQNSPIAIVGNGRVARHFAHYLRLCDIDYLQWSRKDNGHHDPFEYFQECQTVLLLISDKSLLSFVESNPQLKSKQLVHFSGSMTIEGIPSIHPLMTFTNQLYSLDKYQKIPFIFEKGNVSLQDILPELSNPSYSIPCDQKDLYHSLCVLSGNFTTMLWQKVFVDFNKHFGLPDEVLLPYMSQVFENVATSWQDALTGPLVRQDHETIQNNINALCGDTYQDVYRAFARTASSKEYV